LVRNSKLKNLAVEDDWGGGTGVLQESDDQVEAAAIRSGVLIQGNSDGLNPGNLINKL
jgi:hypothetical protein